VRALPPRDLALRSGADAANEWVLSALVVRLRATGRRITILEDEAPNTPACAAVTG